MLPSRQYFRALVNENEGDARFTQNDFKNRLRVLYFIHYNNLLIYWEFTIPMLNLTLQTDVVGKIYFNHERALNTSHVQTGFVNKWRRLFHKSSTFIEVQLPKDRGKKLYIISGIFKIDLYRSDLQRMKV